MYESLGVEKKTVIFVHGSLSAPEGYANPQGAKGSWRSLYRQILEQFNTEKSIEYNNKNNFSKRKNRGYLFEKNKLPLLIGKESGLHEIKKANITPTAYTNIYQKLKQQNNNSNEEYYIFNWDGDLSKKSRAFYAKILSEEIKKLNENNERKIDLYCHSHGGNLALISAVKTKFHDIYLMGTPIGKTTKEIIESIPKENYRHIYNIYGTKDNVQIKDPFFDPGYFPGRVIATKNEKIFNIEIKLENETKHINHEDFFIFNEERPYSPLIIPLHNFGEKLISIHKEKKNEDNNNFIVTIKQNNEILNIIKNTEDIKPYFFTNILSFFKKKKKKKKNNKIKQK